MAPILQAISGSGGGSGGAATALQIVFAPGHPSPPPGVYTSWAEAVDAVNAYPDFDRDLIVSAFYGTPTVPAGFTTTFMGPGVVTLRGYTVAAAFAVPNVELVCGDGATFTNGSLRSISNFLTLVQTGSTALYTVPSGSPLALIMEKGARLRADGTAPVIDFQDTTGSAGVLAMLFGSQLDTGASPAITISGGAGGILFIQAFDICQIQAGTVDGPAGSVFSVALVMTATVDEAQMASGGLFLLQGSAGQRFLNTQPTLVTSLPHTILPTQSSLIVTAAPGSVALPPIGLLQGTREIVVSNQSPGGITLDVSGGDMILTGGATVASAPIAAGDRLRVVAIPFSGLWADVT